MKHTHSMHTETVKTYAQSLVTLEPNPAAHGDFSIVETCKCGATRQSNHNGRHTEHGIWGQ